MASRDQVKASHILIKHQGSRRKASWKDPEGKIIMATTREAAVEQLRSIREDIVCGKANFEDVATRVSDCSSAKRGGDLGLLFSSMRFQLCSEDTASDCRSKMIVVLIRIVSNRRLRFFFFLKLGSTGSLYSEIALLCSQTK